VEDHKGWHASFAKEVGKLTGHLELLSSVVSHYETSTSSILERKDRIIRLLRGLEDCLNRFIAKVDDALKKDYARALDWMCKAGISTV
jgi:hypothetical protein